MGERFFFLGSPREQLIEELESALKMAKNLDKKKVTFSILDHDISYYFNDKGDDVIEPKLQRYKRHFLVNINGVNYHLEPKNNGFTLARYNESEYRLERLCDSLNWYYGACDGKKFFSTKEIVYFFIENISEKTSKLLIAHQVCIILSYYPGRFPWFT